MPLINARDIHRLVGRSYCWIRETYIPDLVNHHKLSPAKRCGQITYYELTDVRAAQAHLKRQTLKGVA